MTESPFEDFVATRSPVLLRTAYLLCGGDRGAAEDLLQDVLERVYPRWRRIHHGAEPYVRGAGERRGQPLATAVEAGHRSAAHHGGSGRPRARAAALLPDNATQSG